MGQSLYEVTPIKRYHVCHLVTQINRCTLCQTADSACHCYHWNVPDTKGSSIIINVIKSVHRALFFVTPSLPPKRVLWKCWFLMTPYENAMHYDQHFKSVQWPLTPSPQRALCTLENDDNYGRPLNNLIVRWHSTLPQKKRNGIPPSILTHNSTWLFI